MGLAATQARFLQLTARKSNIEYQAQQITFQRLQMAKELQGVATEYENKMYNKKLTFSFNTGTGTSKVDLSYANYKDYMNQQLEGLSTSQDKYYLVSARKDKIVVASQAEKDAMLASFASMNIEGKDSDSDGKSVKRITADDIIVEEDLDNLQDPNKFQDALRNGKYYFARYVQDETTNEWGLKTEGLDTLGGGAITEEYDKSDDAQAQATFDRQQREIQKKDKMLEMDLNRLESEREAVSTELESVSKVLDEAVKTFNMNS